MAEKRARTPSKPVGFTREQAEAEFLICGRVLTGEYVYSSEKCLVKFVKCGHEKTETLSNAKRSKRVGATDYCKECGDFFTHEEAVEKFAMCGRVLLEKYEGSKYRHLVKLKCGHTKIESLNGAQKVKKQNREDNCQECSPVLKHKNDISRKIANCLRSTLNGAIKAQLAAKRVSAVKDLGCDLDFFMNLYIPSLWEEGMTWENHTFDGWHIDHVKPLASFDLTDPEEQRKAVYYTNLQPLWAPDNLKKNSRFKKAL